ncbi:hypothetical protein, partial [Alkalibacillus haloalkaliphilus]|uniref:hypothetical protein n=1 Tax=Alkalibacillus haloalkaliphilus TaxID=94136 RepID=UPI001C3FAAEC
GAHKNYLALNFISAQQKFSVLTQSLSAFGPIYRRSRKLYQRSAQFIGAHASFISTQPNLSALTQSLSAFGTIYQHSHAHPHITKYNPTIIT